MITTAKLHIIHSLTTLLSNLHIYKLYWQQLGATSQRFALNTAPHKLTKTDVAGVAWTVFLGRLSSAWCCMVRLYCQYTGHFVAYFCLSVCAPFFYSFIRTTLAEINELIDWLIDWLTDWLTDTDWLIYLFIYFLCPRYSIPEGCKYWEKI